ncbi:MAG: phosphodiesterase [Pseudomonadota bacterium]
MALIVHLTDLHLRPPGVLTRGTVDCASYTDAAIKAVAARHGDADAIIITGDVADLGEAGAYEQLALMLEAFAAPVLLAPGNHDRTGPFREVFGRWPGVGDGPVEGKVCHAHDVADARIVMLDSSVDGLDRGDHFGALGAVQIAWLDSLLREEKPTLIALHHPPFITGMTFLDRIRLQDADDLAAVLRGRNHVRRIVCGHVHRTIVAGFAGAPAITVPGVAHQTALTLGSGASHRSVMEPPSYGVHLIGAQDASHVALVDVYDAPGAVVQRETA